MCEVGKIKKLDFQQLSNDLFWSFHCFDYKCSDKKEREKWGYNFDPLMTHKVVGYNDKYWWDNVATQHKEITCQCGRVYKLDLRNLTVELVKDIECVKSKN